MTPASPAPPPAVGWLVAFGFAVAAHFAVSLVGWADLASVEQDFREAQTALSAHFIQADNNYSLAYPTPVLGKPWSIPLEFPLYQWTVAALSGWFDWPLVQTGRGVSLACFYLTLPAWYLLLGCAQLPPPRRLSVLMLMVASPVYLHFSRSFLIESMALCLASWHAWAVVQVLRGRRSAPWLLAAWATGIPAALVKVTTWAAVLLPCAIFTLWLMTRPAARPARLGCWALAAVLPGLLAALWWVRTADAIKALNPGADFLNSVVLLPFNFGTLALRMSPDFWSGLVRQWTTLLFPGIALLAVLIAGLLHRSQWRPLFLVAVGSFFGSQLLFPHLYVVHSYYFYANAFLLVGAVGLVGCQLLDAERLPRPLRAGLWLLLFAAGPLLFSRNFLPRQRLVISAPTGLAQAVQAFTEPDQVLALFGEDWSSSLPFATKRRAMAVPAGTEEREEHWLRRLAAMEGEPIAGALVLGEARVGPGAASRRLASLSMLPHPLFTYEDRIDFYVHRDLASAAVARLRGGHFAGVRFPPAGPIPAGERRFEPTTDAAAFMMVNPFPLRYSTPYGAEPWFVYGNELVLLAHSGTWLEMSAPPGTSRLHLAYGMISEAFQQHGSDGVEVSVESISAGRPPLEIWRIRVHPREVETDRARPGTTVPLPPGTTQLRIRVLPGPAGDPAYDWFFLRLATVE